MMMTPSPQLGPPSSEFHGRQCCTSSNNPRQAEIRSLTGLRGIAAIYVVIYHYMSFYDSRSPPNWSLQEFLSHGYLSVDLFFVLSGFVMAMTYGSSFESPRPGSYWRFLGHRIARVYPLYLLVTIVGFLIHSIGIGHAEILPHLPSTLIANVLMVQSWGLAPSFEWPSWSISTEWGAYVAFPLLLTLAMSKTRGVSAAVGCVCTTSLGFLAYADWWSIPSTDRSGPLDLVQYQSLAPLMRCLVEFTLGLLTYRVSRRCSVKQVRAVASASVPVSFAILILLSHRGVDIAVVLLVPVLLLSLSSDTGVVASVLQWAPLHRLGVVSYALYLTHPYFGHFVTFGEFHLAAVGIGKPRLLASLIVGVAAITISNFVFAFIERPSRRVFRQAFDAATDKIGLRRW